MIEQRDATRVNRNWVQPTSVFHFLAALSLTFALAACGGGSAASQSGPPQPVTFTAKSGVAQKGPLIKGSTVTAQELGSNLSPTGKQYSYQTTSDLGNFSPTSAFGSQYIGLIATGYYFDELANAVSTGPVTLNGYSDLSVDSVLNANLLTTLAYQRIQNLVTKSNMPFAAARAQAEGEVLTALGIPNADYGSFSTLDLGGNTNGDQILAAVSSIFVYGNSSGPLSALIANFQNDLGANGLITSAATKAALATAAKAINPAAVAANLTQAYSSVGVVFTASSISDWVDQDGDGVIGKFKFQVGDAAPSSMFTFPSFVVAQVAGTSVSVTAGQLSVNGIQVNAPVNVSAGDVLTVSPGIGTFPNGVVTAYLLTGGNKVARVSFVSALLSITVTPATASIPKGLTQQFAATGTFSDTSTADLTKIVNWTSGTPAVATVGAISGLSTSIAVGSTLITATSGSVSGTTMLSVTPAIIESISIAPNPALSGSGLSQPFTATGTFSDATTANVTSISNWMSSTPSIATVGPTTGMATGVALGSTTITATIGTVSSTAAFSIVTTSWFPTGNLSTARESQTATLLPSGLVLVAGGATVSNGAPIPSAELYSPAAHTWSSTSSMSTPRSGHSATLLSSGMVLVVGGTNVAPPSGQTLPVLASAELYNPVAGTWSPTGSMSTARSGHTATLLKNGFVLVEGGSGTTSAELYDPVAGTWSPTGSTLNAHYGETATLLANGNVLVAGWYDIPLANQIYTSELYDPVAGTWSATGGMSTPRFFHTATLLSNGKVLVVGGSNAAFVLTASAELYDPNAATWSPTGSLSIPREGHTATLLTNGMVLVAGGNTPLQQGINTYYPPVASTELYDPVASTWTLSASMTTARSSHSSMLLPNGVVLVEGGDSGNQPGALASAELYW